MVSSGLRFKSTEEGRRDWPNFSGAGLNGLLLGLNMLPLGGLDGGRLTGLVRRRLSGTPNRIRTGDLHLERVAS